MLSSFLFFKSLQNLWFCDMRAVNANRNKHSWATTSEILWPLSDSHCYSISKALAYRFTYYYYHDFMLLELVADIDRHWDMIFTETFISRCSCQPFHGSWQQTHCYQYKSPLAHSMSMHHGFTDLHNDHLNWHAMPCFQARNQAVNFCLKQHQQIADKNAIKLYVTKQS